MITIRNGNLFDASDGLICHQVNCKGNMGRGIAKTFRERFPNSFREYVAACQTYSPEQLLGGVQIQFLSDSHIVPCCMFAQNDWRGHNVCNTQYWAFRECCRKIANYINHCEMPSLPINMPYGIGAGLGGGDWQIIYGIIEEELANYNVILWKLDA